MKVMRTIVTLSAVIAVLALGAGAATAASPHFKKSGSPVCTVGDLSVECRATLAGLGNEDLLIETTVTGFAVYECQNPGGNLVPGQNKVLEGPVTEPTTIPSDSFKNGNVTFVTNPVALDPDETVSGADAGCPNGNWSGVNPTATITAIDMTISQGGELLFTCSASDEDGLEGRVALDC